MAVDMIARKDMRYKTRRLKAGDGFRAKSEAEARVLQYLKKAERTDNTNRKVALDDARQSVGLAPLSKDSEDIAAVRQEYFDKLGRRAFNGWSVAELRKRIAEA